MSGEPGKESKEKDRSEIMSVPTNLDGSVDRSKESEEEIVKLVTDFRQSHPGQLISVEYGCQPHDFNRAMTIHNEEEFRDNRAFSILLELSHHIGSGKEPGPDCDMKYWAETPLYRR